MASKSETPVSVEYKECSLEPNSEKNIDATRIYSLEDVSYRIPFQTSKLCSNELCPYKISYKECTDSKEKLNNIDRNKMEICTNELCPYKTINKQFKKELEICTNERCPYNQIKGEIQEKKSSKELPICKNVNCSYKLLYDQLETEKDKTESLDYKEKNEECITDSTEKICGNKECPYRTDNEECIVIPSTDTCSVKTCPYWTKTEQCILDPVLKIYSNESYRYQNLTDPQRASCSSITCPYKTKYVDCKLDSVTNICSNEECPFGFEYVECVSDSIPSVKSEETIQIQEYKFETSTQYTDVYRDVEEILNEILSSFSAYREELYPVLIENIPCAKKTCKIEKRQILETYIPFEDVSIFAKEFIDCIILDATDAVIKKLNEEQPQEGYKLANYLQPNRPSEIEALEHQKFIFSWPSIKDFTIPLGAQRITEYITCCDVQEQWLCGIYYKNKTKEPLSKFYHYEIFLGYLWFTNIFIPRTASNSKYLFYDRSFKSYTQKLSNTCNISTGNEQICI